MVIINISGNLYGVNGHVINGSFCSDGTSKKIDETKKESANGIKRITIDSCVNVNISACDTTEVTAHLNGSAIVSNDFSLSVTKLGDELRISVMSNGTAIHQSAIVFNNFSSCDMMLDVRIPTREFERISVKSINSNIAVISPVNANRIVIENVNGSADVSAVFQSLDIDCQNGNVNVNSKAHCDVTLNIASKNGNVNVSIKNLGFSKVLMNSKNGSCRNAPKLMGIYTSYGFITTKNGNASFS